MPRKIQKSLRNYVSKIKNQVPRSLLPPSSFSGSRNWILSGCKHVKTLSFAIGRDDHRNNSGAAGKRNEAVTLADVDRFLYENFKSLFFQDSDEFADERPHSTREVNEENDTGAGGLPNLSPDRFPESGKQNFKSSRFFVRTGSSGSLLEEAGMSMTTTTTTATLPDGGAGGYDGSSFSSFSSTGKSNKCADAEDKEVIKKATLPEDCIAVLTYSVSPGNDFRTSMQEMVDARARRYGKLDWSFMEELLISYLDINDKESHKYILRAFADVVVGLKEEYAGDQAWNAK